MTRYFVVPIVSLLIGTAPLAAQEQPDSVQPPPRSYHSFSGMYSQIGQGEFDIVGAYGRAIRRGNQAPLMFRVEARGGFSFWGSSKDLGYLVGLHPGMILSWTGLNNYLEFGGPVDVSLLLDGGAYYTSNLNESQGEQLIMPTIGIGGGLRFRGEKNIGTVDLVWEERIGKWESRMFFRIIVFTPR
jgi:hypothetical protein